MRIQRRNNPVFPGKIRKMLNGFPVHQSLVVILENDRIDFPFPDQRRQLFLHLCGNCPGDRKHILEIHPHNLLIGGHDPHLFGGFAFPVHGKACRINSAFRQEAPQLLAGRILADHSKCDRLRSERCDVPHHVRRSPRPPFRFPDPEHRNRRLLRHPAGGPDQIHINHQIPEDRDPQFPGPGENLLQPLLCYLHDTCFPQLSFCGSCLSNRRSFSSRFLWRERVSKLSRRMTNRPSFQF